MNLFQFIFGIFCLFCYCLTIYFINKRIDRVNDKISELDSKILRMRCDIGILSDNQKSVFDFISCNSFIDKMALKKLERILNDEKYKKS